MRAYGATEWLNAMTVVDALWIFLSEESPGRTEKVAEGVILDTTKDGHVTGIEILNAFSKMNGDTVLG